MSGPSHLPPAGATGFGAPLRRQRRWFRRAVLGGLLAIAIVVGGAFYLLRTPPASWQRYERFKAGHTTKQIEAIAQSLEDALHDLVELDLPLEVRRNAGKASRPTESSHPANRDASEIDPTMVRIDEVRTLMVTREQLMAIVALRHEQWLESRGYVKPDEIRDVMVDLEDGRMVASFKYEGRGFSQVLSAKFRVNFKEDGTAVVHLESFDAGRLPMPSDRIGAYLRDKGGSAQAEAAGDWLAKLDNFRFKPVLDDLPHRRRARVLGYRIDGDQIELTLRVQDHRTYQEMNKPFEMVEARSARTSGE